MAETLSDAYASKHFQKPFFMHWTTFAHGCNMKEFVTDWIFHIWNHKY